MDSQGYVETCVFCKVVKGLVRAEVLYQDDMVMAFNDIHPQAPIHVLVIPKQHMTALWEADPTHVIVLGRIVLGCNEVARKLGVLDTGYRIVCNTGVDAGQSVDHVHFHVLGGRKLKWPPG